MEHEARATQDEIQVVHEERSADVREPLYGLAPEPGSGGPASVGDAAQPTTEVPVEEPPEPGEVGTNMTWGIVFGGILLLVMLTIVLYYGIGSTYSSSPLSTYPLK
jgi:uncharacterized integral membrane protein